VQPVPTDALERAAAHRAERKSQEVAPPTGSFRSNEPEGARERTLAAVTSLCGSATVEGDVVRSDWQRTDDHDELTRVYRRCVVSLTPEPSDGSVDVRVVFELADCPRLKLTEGGLQRSGITADEVATRCHTRSTTSPESAARLHALATHLQEDVFRR